MTAPRPCDALLGLKDGQTFRSTTCLTMRRQFSGNTTFVRKSRVSLLFIFLLVAHPMTFADTQPIRLDGRFDDWTGSEEIEAPSASTLLRSVRVNNSQDYLFVELQLNREIVLQEPNPVALFADTDGDPATGRRTGGIGADVQYNFGALEAIRHSDGIATPVSHTEIGISWVPTFSADRFELALPLTLFGGPERRQRSRPGNRRA